MCPYYVLGEEEENKPSVSVKSEAAGCKIDQVFSLEEVTTQSTSQMDVCVKGEWYMKIIRGIHSFVFWLELLRELIQYYFNGNSIHGDSALICQ